MLGRCGTKTNTSYHNYGGRGIRVCKRWLDSFENFFADMGLKPSPKHSIDRIENDGDYTPSNCRWATKKDQSNNRRSNVRLTHKGKTQTIAQWADELKMSRVAIAKRIRNGWATEKALETPIRMSKLK